MAAEHEAAGRVAVEPMRQSGAARQAEAQRIEIVLEAASALRAAMHVNTGRLVDHQHQSVAVKQPRLHLFRRHLALPSFGETAITVAAKSKKYERQRIEKLVAASEWRSQAIVVGTRHR